MTALIRERLSMWSDLDLRSLWLKLLRWQTPPREREKRVLILALRVEEVGGDNGPIIVSAVIAYAIERRWAARHDDLCARSSSERRPCEEGDRP